MADLDLQSPSGLCVVFSWLSETRSHNTEKLTVDQAATVLLNFLQQAREGGESRIWTYGFYIHVFQMYVFHALSITRCHDGHFSCFWEKVDISRADWVTHILYTVIVQLRPNIQKKKKINCPLISLWENRWFRC